MASIATELMGGVLRLVGELLVEWLFQRTGHLLLNRRMPNAEPGHVETLVGAIVWIGLAVLALAAWAALVAS